MEVEVAVEVVVVVVVESARRFMAVEILKVGTYGLVEEEEGFLVWNLEEIREEVDSK